MKTETYKILESLDKNIKLAIFGGKTFKNLCEESNYIFQYCNSKGWDVEKLKQSTFWIYYDQINSLPDQLSQANLRKANSKEFVQYWMPHAEAWELDDDSES